MPEYSIPVSLVTPLGTLTFNQYAAAGYLRLTGFSISRDTRSNVLPTPQRDGAIVGPTFRGGAYPVVNGQVAAFSDLTMRATLMDLVRAHGEAIRNADGTLLWTPSGQPGRQMTVRCLDDPGAGDDGLTKTFQLQLIARDATTYGQALYTVSSSALAAATGGSLVFPITFPITFGAGSGGGVATVLNAGNAPSWPTLRVYGQIAAPQIVLVSTGQTISLPGLTLSTGQYAEIDTLNETVRLNGSPTSSLLAFLDPSSDFFALPAGTSVVQLLGSGYDGNARVDTIYRDGYA